MTDEGGKDSGIPPTPEQRADAILNDVESIEFDRFQEYAYRSQKEEDRMITSKLTHTDLKRGTPDDILDIHSPDLSSWSSGSPRHWAVLARLFGVANPEDSRVGRELQDQLFCAIGEKNKKIIVQGAMKSSGDKDSRVGPSSFRIVFKAQTGAENFIDWLQGNPNQALEHTILRGLPKSDSEANDTGSPVPVVYKTPIEKLHFIDLQTSNKTIKDFPKAS